MSDKDFTPTEPILTDAPGSEDNGAQAPSSDNDTPPATATAKAPSPAAAPSAAAQGPEPRQHQGLAVDQSCNGDFSGRWCHRNVHAEG